MTTPDYSRYEAPQTWLDALSTGYSSSASCRAALTACGTATAGLA